MALSKPKIGPLASDFKRRHYPQEKSRFGAAPRSAPYCAAGGVRSDRRRYGIECGLEAGAERRYGGDDDEGDEGGDQAILDRGYATLIPQEDTRASSETVHGSPQPALNIASTLALTH